MNSAYLKNPHPGEILQEKTFFCAIDKGKSGKQQADEEDEETSFEYFSKEDRFTLLFKFPHTEAHRIPHHEEEAGEDKVGKGEPVPGGVLERGIDAAPASGIVHQHHQGNGQGRPLGFDNCSVHGQSLQSRTTTNLVPENRASRVVHLIFAS